MLSALLQQLKMPIALLSVGLFPICLLGETRYVLLWEGDNYPSVNQTDKELCWKISFAKPHRTPFLFPNPGLVSNRKLVIMTLRGFCPISKICKILNIYLIYFTSYQQKYIKILFYRNFITMYFRRQPFT